CHSTGVDDEGPLTRTRGASLLSRTARTPQATLPRPSDGVAATAPSLRLRLASLLALAVATAVTFWGVLHNGWVRFDDDVYVYDHPVVSQGLSLRGMLGFLHESHGANWVPLTAWSHMLDVQLFGLAPAGHHATSLLLHILNAVLLALVLHRMTGAWWRSLFVAAFFA